jgi:hypothetical protein
MLQKAKDADVFGIVVGTLGVGEFPFDPECLYQDRSDRIVDTFKGGCDDPS